MQNAREQSVVAAEDRSAVQAARKLYEDFARGDIEAVLGDLDPDVEWREAEGNPYQPDGTPFRGPQEVLDRLFIRLGTEWDGFTVTPHAFHEAGGGLVIVEARYTGLYRSTGRRVDAEVCHFLTYRGGRLTGFRQYVDTAQLQAVMGARVS